MPMQKLNTQNQMYKKNNSLTTIFFNETGLAKYIAIIWTITPVIGGFLLLGFIKPIEQLVISNNIYLVLYILLFGLLAGLGLIPTYAAAIVAGWVYGFYLGSFVALSGICFASIIGWLLTKYLIGSKVLKFIDKYPRSAALRSAFINENGYKTMTLVALLRISPNSPFALFNLILAGIGTRLIPNTVGTLLGIAPRTIFLVLLSATASSSGAIDLIDFLNQDKGFSWIAFGIISLLLVGIILTILSRK